MDGYGKYFYCICRLPPSRPRATQTDMAFPREGQRAGSSAKNTRGPHYVNRSFANGCPKFNCAVSVSHVRQAEPIRTARRAHSAPSTFPWHERVLDVCRWKLNRRDCDEIVQISNSWRQTYHNLQNFSNFRSLRKNLS